MTNKKLYPVMVRFLRVDGITYLSGCTTFDVPINFNARHFYNSLRRKTLKVIVWNFMREKSLFDKIMVYLTFLRHAELIFDGDCLIAYCEKANRERGGY